ncbi:MAG: prepilin-type N-terminal cleavage/methylation domain-containing protein [bacterium]|nr:prepilin-type N-terminal cleavage/methylation domain-containing protein [bacterium]
MIRKNGFSLIEVVVSVGITSVIVLLLSSFIFELNFSNSKTKADRGVLENARRILDQIAYEIKGATSVYASTTSASQLSLQTQRYLPSGEVITFIDFFLCGTDLCLKKESQNPVLMNSETVSISSLAFTRVANGSNSSIKVQVTVDYKNPTSETSGSSVTLNQTVSLRNY